MWSRRTLLANGNCQSNLRCDYPGKECRCGVVPDESQPCLPLHECPHSRGQIIAEIVRYERLLIGAPRHNVATVFGPARLVRWTLDLDGGSVTETPLDDRPITFPRVDERYTGLRYRWGYAAGEGDILIGYHAMLRYDVRSIFSQFVESHR